MLLTCYQDLVHKTQKNLFVEIPTYTSIYLHLHKDIRVFRFSKVHQDALLSIELLHDRLAHMRKLDPKIYQPEHTDVYSTDYLYLLFLYQFYIHLCTCLSILELHQELYMQFHQSDANNRYSILLIIPNIFRRNNV